MADEQDRLEQIARSLANIEAMYGESLRKQEEDRAESKQRLKESDERQKEMDEDFKTRQKRWDAQEKTWDSTGLMKNPWIQPAQIGNLLLMAALLVLAIVATYKR